MLLLLLRHAFVVLSTERVRGRLPPRGRLQRAFWPPDGADPPSGAPEGALAPDGACHLPTGLPMTDGPVCVCMTFLWYFIPVYCTARSVLGALEAPATRGRSGALVKDYL